MRYYNILIYLLCALFTISFGYCNSLSIDCYFIEIENDKELFNQDKLDSYKANEDYNYSDEKNVVSWWTDFKQWLNAQWQKLFGENYNPDSLLVKFIRALPYIIIPFAFVLLIWFLARSNPGSQIMRQHTKSKVILTEEEELLMKRDLESLAEQAISNQEPRLAIRYLYLHCIKRLDMKRIINYTNEKTNYEYIKEIKIEEISRNFRQLTLFYEQTWYGDLVFDEIYFDNFKQQYQAFHNILDQKEYAQV